MSGIVLNALWTLALKIHKNLSKQILSVFYRCGNLESECVRKKNCKTTFVQSITASKWKIYDSNPRLSVSKDLLPGTHQLQINQKVCITEQKRNVCYSWSENNILKFWTSSFTNNFKLSWQQKQQMDVSNITVNIFIHKVIQTHSRWPN